jgi:hypothetical protein
MAKVNFTQLFRAAALHAIKPSEVVLKVIATEALKRLKDQTG